MAVVVRFGLMRYVWLWSGGLGTVRFGLMRYVWLWSGGRVGLCYGEVWTVSRVQAVPVRLGRVCSGLFRYGEAVTVRRGRVGSGSAVN